MFYDQEGATPIDEYEKEGLLIKHISTREELNEWEQRNIIYAYNWLDKLTTKDVLNEGFIKELHNKMFGKVWSWAGYYRKTDKNIGVDWTQIPILLRQLLDDLKFWIDNKTYSDDEIATRFHHRLVQIHLFPNGNGRHARVMSDILVEKIFDQNLFTWGSGNLNEKGNPRKVYIQALRLADANDYKLLLEFVRS